MATLKRFLGPHMLAKREWTEALGEPPHVRQIDILVLAADKAHARDLYAGVTGDGEWTQQWFVKSIRQATSRSTAQIGNKWQAVLDTVPDLPAGIYLMSRNAVIGAPVVRVAGPGAYVEVGRIQKGPRSGGAYRVVFVPARHKRGSSSH